MITSWTGAAEALAEQARELGFTAAGEVAAAWRARCDPDATRGLVRAAHALTGGDALPRMWDAAVPSPSADAFLGAAEELEAEAAALGRHGTGMGAACESAREQAAAGYAAAQAQAAAPGPGAAAARQHMADMARVIADCDAALDVLRAVLGRLAYAATCFRTVPADYAEAYDVPLQFIADGGILPWSGHFLTGASTR